MNRKQTTGDTAVVEWHGGLNRIIIVVWAQIHPQNRYIVYLNKWIKKMTREDNNMR